jgi:hypothetical protein
MAEKLADMVRAEVMRPVDPRVSAMAAAIASLHPGAARAVLFYGSCLRQRAIDDALEGMMLDFYLIVSDYRDAYHSIWLTVANNLVPPNVFPFAHDGLTAKYAVLSEADFARLNGPQAGDVSVWARFAQPSRLVWAADDAAHDKAVAAVARAAPTLLSYAAPMVDEGGDPLEIWRRGFALTYASELRAERQGRPESIVDIEPERYRRFSAAAGAASAPGAARAWARFRRRGKVLSLVRLAKAATTYAGGADYLAWKINRHAGTAIVVRPWQRRWPILGALILLPRLFLRGAIR